MHATLRNVLGLSLALALMPGVGAASARAPLQTDFDDDDIAEAVETELTVQRGVFSHDIDVTVRQGVVTLDGEVGDLLSRERAAQVAASVAGVASIINRIEVRQSDVDDRTLVADLEQALLVDPAIEAGQLTVTARNGRVELSGTVDSWQERELAETTVRGVHGVRDLVSRIVVDVPDQRSDEEIAEEVIARLQWDVYVDPTFVEVEVDDGEVRLSGTLHTVVERDRARRLAAVAGVASVDDSGIVIRPSGEDHKRYTPDLVIDDKEIQKAIQTALLYDPRVTGVRIAVGVQDGAVSLRGMVENPAARAAALQVARDTVGVWTVDDRLKVRPASASTDSDLAQAVQAALERDAIVHARELSVAADHGRVWLFGAVDDAFERERAIAVASQVGGVQTVIDRTELPVQHGPWTPGASLLATWRTDAELERDIERQLMWSPWVDADDVQVEVDDGVATLTGTVDSWFEKRKAVEQAFEGGALSVDDDLGIRITEQDRSSM